MPESSGASGASIMQTHPKRTLRVGTLLFVGVALGIATALAYAGRLLYMLAGRGDADYYAKLGELILQLAVVAIVGALAKALIDWGTALRARQIENQEKRMDFLRRVRTVHVTIESARDLLNAHASPKTYGEQLRRLMALRPEVEEVSEDVQAAAGLFAREVEIRAGLEGMVDYLKAGAEEYVRHHADVASHKKGGALVQTIHEAKMTWISDLMESGPRYQNEYVANLTQAKGNMRLETYVAS